MKAGESFKVGVDSRTNRVVHIDEVEDGFAHAICPDCKGRLIAANHNRSSRKYATYFRHAADTTCAGETLIHRWAKQVIAERLEILIPDWTSTHLCVDVTGTPHSRTHHVPADIARLVSCELEKEVRHDECRRRPDIFAETEQGNALCVEIHVHNAVNQERADFYDRAGLSCIEIDLQLVPDFALAGTKAFSNYVVSGAPRAWVSCSLHSGEEARLAEDCAKAAAGVRLSPRDLLQAARRALEPDGEDVLPLPVPPLPAAGAPLGEAGPAELQVVHSLEDTIVTGQDSTHAADALCRLADNSDLAIDFQMDQEQEQERALENFYVSAGVRALQISLIDVPASALRSQNAFFQYVRRAAPRRWLNVHQVAIPAGGHEAKKCLAPEDRKERRKEKARWRLYNQDFIELLNAYLDQDNRRRVQRTFDTWLMDSKGRHHQVYRQLVDSYGELPEVINIQVDGELAFKCHRTVWQWEVYRRVVVESFVRTRPSDGGAIEGMRLSGWYDYVPRWTPEELYAQLRQQGVPIVDLCSLSQSLARGVLLSERDQPAGLMGLKVKEWRALPKPISAIRRYLGVLVDRRFLHKDGDAYMLMPLITPPLCPPGQPNR